MQWHNFFLKKREFNKRNSEYNFFIFFIVFRFKTKTYQSSQDKTRQRVKVAACGIKCTDLTKDAIKIQATFFSHKKILK